MFIYLPRYGFRQKVNIMELSKMINTTTEGKQVNKLHRENIMNIAKKNIWS